MDDPNNRRLQLIKEIPASPSSEETTCASTIGTSSQHPNNTVATQQTTQTPRSLMQRQILHLGLASSGAMSVFIISVVPAHILMGITVVFLLWLSFFYRLFQMLRLDYQRALNGRGLGDLLPESWYDQLVNVSFHDFMTDGTFVRENQHFMLYFIPGISVDQLNAYVERLVPRHRNRLQRPGLGHFLGDGFMRHLIGDEGLAERRPNVPNSPRLVPRRLELEAVNEDAASGLGDDDEVDDDVRLWGNEPNEEAAVIEAAARAAVIEASPSVDISRADSDSEESEEDLAIEEAIIFDAAVAGVMTYANWALSFTQQSVSSSIIRSAGRALRVTLGLGVFGAGAGLFGIWAGFWSPRELRFPTQMSRQSSTILWSSTIASGATAGLFMLFGYSSPPAPPSGVQPTKKVSKASASAPYGKKKKA